MEMLLEAPAAPRAKKSEAAKSYLPQLDGLRGVAILAVIFHHFGFHPPGWMDWGPVGPNLFFALSGYLITLSLWKLRDKAAAEAQGFGWLLAKFHARRMARLLPAIVVLLAIGWLWGLPEYRESWAWHLTFLTNMLMVWNNAWVGSLSHFWSLSLQEQFYLLWPMVLLVPRALFPYAMLIVALGAGAFRLGCIWTGVPEFARWFLLPSSLDAFAVGGLVAWMLRHGWGKIVNSPKWAGWFCIGAVAALVFSRYLRYLPDTHPGTAAVEWFECIFFCWLLLRLVGAPHSFAARALTLRPLIYVGKVSYGIYVFHALVSVALSGWLASMGLSHLPFVRAVVLSGVSIAVAAASWRWIERPLGSWVRRLHRPVGIWAGKAVPVFRAMLSRSGDAT